MKGNGRQILGFFANVAAEIIAPLVKGNETQTSTQRLKVTSAPFRRQTRDAG